MSESSETVGGIGAIVLAAGESRRLGRAKQLVRIGGRTLLERTISAALEAGADPVVVVLGASAREIRGAMPAFPESVRFVVNDAWSDGMGRSIARGVEGILETHPSATAALVLVCDQPLLDAAVLRMFMQRSAAGRGTILLADYGTGRGPPVLFPRQFFDELLALHGDTGARDVHRRHPDRVSTVLFPGGATDIDTPADLDRA